MRMRTPFRAAIAAALALAAACSLASPDAHMDVHSFARPDSARVTHVDLDLNLDFTTKTVQGHADLTVQRKEGSAAALVLDCNGLFVESVRAVAADGTLTARGFALGKPVEHLGEPLTITLQPGDARIRVAYHTAQGAEALQWLAPEQTNDKSGPFLYTQGQAILTRSWIPLQDSPGVRVTYTAKVRAPEGLTVLMSARREPRDRDGAFRFRMDKAIPPYLMALACGKLAFEGIGERCGVWAEPGTVAAAAREFADMEKMLLACEGAFGPYRWERYEVLILPPAFPFGGMENPMLTFATPTILAGDRSLVGLVAHELAHSWSGNLVTNATWRDFWLNEGCTVYLENRIMEIVYGKERAAMELHLGLKGLDDELKTLQPADQVLHIDLAGRNPDDNMTAVPYDKGAAFLHRLAQVFGRERFEKCMQGWFDSHAFQSVTTADFVAYLDANLMRTDPQRAAQVDVHRWVYEPGLPDDVVRPTTDAFTRIDAQRTEWLGGRLTSKDLGGDAWIPQQWLHFLGGLPAQVDVLRLQNLDATYHLTQTGNAEIAAAWFVVGIRSGYAAVDDATEAFLMRVGRRKFLKPLYEALTKTDAGKARAQAIYARARPRYHAVSVRTLDEMLGVPGQ